MSLFKARDWWYTHCGAGEEEFERGGLCVANVTGDPSGTAQLVTGSLSGTLRVYGPKERDFRVDDLLLETSLGAPILQLEAGRFSGASQLSLAVLHPRRLTVYALAPGPGGAANVVLQKCYEHVLEHTAANMCFGPFGGAPADYVCVQSMDGRLSVFEHESLAFSRDLPNFLLPGPLAYLPQVDAFVTCNSAFELECYKYQVLATSTEWADTGADGALNQHKRVRTDWTLVFGEPAHELLVAQVSRAAQPGQLDVVVLGERTLMCVSEQGAVRWQKRLDYVPVAMRTYLARPGEQVAPHNLLVSSNTGSVMVYQDVHLVWAAKCDEVPLSMRVETVSGVRGMTVTLSETGRLVANYMGTDPPLNVVGAAESKELNYEEMDEEHHRLLAIIRQATSNTKQEPTEQLVVRAQVPTRLDRVSAGDEGEEGRGVTVRLFVSFTGGSSLEDVNLTVQAPPPVVCQQESIVLPSVPGAGGQPTTVAVQLLATGDCLPASTTLTVLAAYLTPMGEPRTARCEVELPMCLFVSAIPPQKNANYKVTVETNRPPPQLPALFEDVLTQTREGMNMVGTPANALTFQYFSGADCTIIVSKSAGRYRLQSNQFEAIWLVAHELVQRLTTYYAGEEGGGQEPFVASFAEALPLHDFFGLVDAHFAVRQEQAALTAAMSDRAHQFRAIQKRLLMRFKDKSPAPLGHLDTLMEGTFMQIVEMGQNMDACQADLRTAANRLACGCQLLLLLVKLRLGLDEESITILKQYISPVVEDCPEQGWEDVTDVAVSTLLRTALAKNAKETAVVAQPAVQLQDTAKLKKHISVVIERLSRGQSLKGAKPS